MRAGKKGGGGSGGGSANAAEVRGTRWQQVAAKYYGQGSRNRAAKEDSDARPELWPAVLLKSMHKHVDGGRDWRRGGFNPRDTPPQSNKDRLLREKQKQVADALVEAKVRSRKARTFARRGFRAAQTRVARALASLQASSSGGGASASEGGGKQGAPTE